MREPNRRPLTAESAAAQHCCSNISEATITCVNCIWKITEGLNTWENIRNLWHTKSSKSSRLCNKANAPVLWSWKWLEKQEWRSWSYCRYSSVGPIQLAIESKDMAAVGQWSSGRCCKVSSVGQPIDDTDCRNRAADVRTAAVKNGTPSDLAHLRIQATHADRARIIKHMWGLIANAKCGPVCNIQIAVSRPWTFYF